MGSQMRGPHRSGTFIANKGYKGAHTRISPRFPGAARVFAFPTISRRRGRTCVA